MHAVIRKRHVAERDRAGASRERAGIRTFDHLRQLVEDRERALGARERRLQIGDQLAQRAERRIELRQVGHDHQQASQRQRARLHVEHADGQRQRGAERGGHADEELEAALKEGDLHLFGNPLRGLADEARVLVIFAAERLDDTDGAERFGDHRHRRAVQPLDLLPAPAQRLAECSRQQIQDRSDAEGNQGELPVDPRDHDDHADERQRRRHHRNEAVEGDALDGIGVVLNAVGRIAGAAAVVVRERQALDVAEQLGAEILQQLLARVGVQHPRQDALDLAQQREREHQRGDEHEHRRVRRLHRRGRQEGDERRHRLRADHGVHGQLDWQRHEQRQRRRRQVQQQRAGNVSPVRPRLQQQPSDKRELRVACAGHVRPFSATRDCASSW